LPSLAVGQPVLDQIRAAAKSAKVVICVLDAARADHLGCYGYPRDTTPIIDQLASESVVFRNHFSPFPATKISTASLFTGLYPDKLSFDKDKALDDGIFTLAQGLKAAGFQTALFSSNFVASPATGVGLDFEHVFAKPLPPGWSKVERISLPDENTWRTPEGLTQVFSRWLAGARSTRFFAYCHFLPPHTPYNAPDDAKDYFAQQPPTNVRQGPFEFPETRPAYGTVLYGAQQWANLYDANLRWGDWGVGEIVKSLREQGVLDNTLLIITADHGEAFGEHGYIYHAQAVYDEAVHIPLLIRFPGKQRLTGDVTALTQTVDVLPTILDLYGIPYPRDSAQGHSLLPLLDGAQRSLRDYAFATCEEPWPSYLVRNSNWSLILYRGGKLRALYDLRTDPGQLHNVIAEHSKTAAAMTAAFNTFARTQKPGIAQFLSSTAAARPSPPGRQRQMSGPARRELRALGYLK
jgi:arylsulfatase